MSVYVGKTTTDTEDHLTDPHAHDQCAIATVRPSIFDLDVNVAVILRA